MKFVLEREHFFQAVTAVQRATATRVIQPILSNIRIECLDASTLKLSATDLDFSIETVVSATCTALGQTTILAKKLAEIISKLPKSELVSVSVNPETQVATIQSGSVVFDIRTLPAEEFPEIPTLDQDTAIEVSPVNFMQAINQTAFAAAGYDANNVLAGVYFKMDQNGLEMAATDGSRLAKRQDDSLANGNGRNASSPETSAVSAIIPAKTLQELSKLLVVNDDDTGWLRVAIADGQIAFRTEQFYIVSRLLDGMYPQYNQLIPTTNPIVLHAPRRSFIEALERMSVMANERTNIVKLSIDKSAMSLEAQTPDVGDSQDTMDVSYDGEPFQIAFNYRYVIDALKVMDTDEVKMETSGSLSPTLFRPKDDKQYLCLVMPVQVK
ncbi:MAG: DNA polymerase III subunit beta [Cyanobacteria bacterium P01_H01_bin.74]